MRAGHFSGGGLEYKVSPVQDSVPYQVMSRNGLLTSRRIWKSLSGTL